MCLTQMHFDPHFQSISKCSHFEEHFGLFQNGLFYTKLIIFFFNINFEMNNLNNHFIVQMFSKWAQNAIQIALQMLFGKTEL